MAVGLYDRIFFYRNGKLDMEAEAVNVGFMGDPLPVATIAKDFAGVSPTPKSIKLDIVRFIPSSGGADVAALVNDFLNTKSVKTRIQFGGSGKQMNSEGYLTGPQMTSGASDHSKLNYSFMGTANPIQ
jgi:hypothetical protein